MVLAEVTATPPRAAAAKLARLTVVGVFREHLVHGHYREGAVGGALRGERREAVGLGTAAETLVSPKAAFAPS